MSFKKISNSRKILNFVLLHLIFSIFSYLDDVYISCKKYWRHELKFKQKKTAPIRVEPWMFRLSFKIYEAVVTKKINLILQNLKIYIY